MRRLLSLLIACLLLLLGASGNNTLKRSLRSAPQSHLRTDLTKAADFGGGPSVFLFIIDDAGNAGFSSTTRPESAWPEKVDHTHGTPNSGMDPIETPNMDQLAEVGVMMMQAHSSALCIATKCEIATGLGPWRTGCENMGWVQTDEFKDNFQWLPEVVDDAGGAAWGFGKLGIGIDLFKRNGMSYYRGAAGNTSANYGHYPLQDIDLALDPDFNDYDCSETAILGWCKGDDPHKTDRIATDVLAKIGTDSRQTFWWIHPHDVHGVVHLCTMTEDGTCRDLDDQWGSGGSIVDAFDDRPWQPGVGQIGSVPATGPFFDPLDGRFGMVTEGWASMFEHVDYKIGEMIDAVDLNRDYVIVRADDGSVVGGTTAQPAVDSHDGWGEQGKGSSGDNSPALWIAGPGIQRGRSYFQMTDRDLYYTILAMMDIDPPTVDEAGEPIVRNIGDGVNMLPYLMGQRMPSRRFIQGQADGAAENDGYWIRDQRTEYKMCFESWTGTSNGMTGWCNPGETGLIGDQLFESPTSAGAITSGSIFEYLFELYTTQHRNIQNDMQSFCHDGSGGLAAERDGSALPAAHVCEDFEQAVPTGCVTDTTADAVDGSPSAGEVECDNNIGPLAGTQDLLFTGTADYLVWEDLVSAAGNVPGTGCTDSGICIADFVFQHSVDGTTEREVFGFREDDDTAICMVSVNQDGDVVLSLQGSSPSAVAEAIPHDTPKKVRLLWDSTGTTTECSLFVDNSVSGTHGETLVKTESGSSQIHADEFYVGNETATDLVQIDNLAIVGHEPIGASKFHPAIEGLGFDMAEGFESAEDCTDLGLVAATGSSDESLCRMNVSGLNGRVVDGHISFSAGTSVDDTNDFWIMDNIACRGLSGETCELQFDFKVDTLGDCDQESLFAIRNDNGADAAMTLSFDAEGANAGAPGSEIVIVQKKAAAGDTDAHNIVINGANCGPSDLGASTTCNVLEGKTYRLRFHFEEDGTDDHIQVWLWRLDEFGNIRDYVGGDRNEFLNGFRDHAEIWLGPNDSDVACTTPHNIAFDNFKIRLIPNANL